MSCLSAQCPKTQLDQKIWHEVYITTPPLDKYYLCFASALNGQDKKIWFIWICNYVYAYKRQKCTVLKHILTHGNGAMKLMTNENIIRLVGNRAKSVLTTYNRELNYLGNICLRKSNFSISWVQIASHIQLQGSMVHIVCHASLQLYVRWCHRSVNSDYMLCFVPGRMKSRWRHFFIDMPFTCYFACLSSGAWQTVFIICRRVWEYHNVMH